MNFDLPEDIAAFREIVRKFAAEEIRPHSRQWDREQAIPDSLIAQLGSLGLMGILTPEEYGGTKHAEHGYLLNAVVIEEIARQDGGIALLLAAHNGLCQAHLNIAASAEQMTKYLPKLASGEWMGAWGLTEPGCGSDAAALAAMFRCAWHRPLCAASSSAMPPSCRAISSRATAFAR